MNKRQRKKQLKKLDECFLQKIREYKTEKRALEKVAILTWSKSWTGIFQKSEISKAKNKQIRKDKVKIWINECHLIAGWDFGLKSFQGEQP